MLFSCFYWNLRVVVYDQPVTKPQFTYINNLYRLHFFQMVHVNIINCQQTYTIRKLCIVSFVLNFRYKPHDATSTSLFKIVLRVQCTTYTYTQCELSNAKTHKVWPHTFRCVCFIDIQLFLYINKCRVMFYINNANASIGFIVVASYPNTRNE